MVQNLLDELGLMPELEETEVKITTGRTNLTFHTRDWRVAETGEPDESTGELERIQQLLGTLPKNKNIAAGISDFFRAIEEGKVVCMSAAQHAALVNQE